MKIFILMLLFLFGCYKPQKVQIIKSDGKSYDFAEVSLPNLKDLFSLQGNNFSFYANQTYFSYEFNEKIKSFNSFNEMLNILQKDIASQPIKLDLQAYEGVYKANSFESLILVSAYYAFEDIRQKAQQYFNISSKAFNHLNIGFYPSLLTSKSSFSAYLTEDNAIYMPNLDSVFLLVAGELKGLPLNINVGAYAHEYFHRIFHKEVWESTNWQAFKKDIKQENYSDSELRSKMLLSSTDEGLADLFAVAYSANPDFLFLSLTNDSKKLKYNKELRNLDGEFANIANYEKLYMSMMPKPWNNICKNSHNFINPNFNHYCLGVLIAKTFYLAADSNIDSLRNDIMPLIHYGLKAIALRLKNNQHYNLYVLLEAVAANAPSEIKSNLCKAYDKKFHSLMGKIPSCTK